MVKLKSSYKLYIRYLFKILLVFIILVLPLFFLFIGNSYIQLFLPIGYSILYFPYAYLIFVLFMNYIFIIFNIISVMNLFVIKKVYAICHNELIFKYNHLVWFIDI